jgi:hypothetical protein
VPWIIILPAPDAQEWREIYMEILVILLFIGFIVIVISIGKDMYDVTETSREERRNGKK